MFPFHSGSELSFQISNYLGDNSNSNSNNSSNNDNNNINTSTSVVYFDSTGVEQNANAPSTTHLHNPAAQPGNRGARTGRPRRREPSVEFGNNEDQGGIDVAQRRIMHREMERQRRHEMANLFSDLRTLLPAEYIRGKRSTCDHLTEAAKYIKDLENNIHELQQKKDELKASSSNNLHGDGDVGCSSSNSITVCNVNIHTFPGAIDVEIIAEVREDDVFPLSRVLHVLIQEGLNVVDCTSSRVNQKWIYVIHCEVSYAIFVDSKQLQQRLMSEIGSSNEQ